jgi:hypothetical protein
MTALLDNTAFIDHLRNRSDPFVLRRGDTGPRLLDEAEHLTVYTDDPELYALCALADHVQPTQQARTLFHLLAFSRQPFPAAMRRTMDRVARYLSVALPADDVLRVFLALRRARANHKPTSRTILRWVLNHPALEVLARRRRRALVDLLEHALGRDVARGCARLVKAIGTPGYLRKHLLRFADNPERIRSVFAHLYGLELPPHVDETAVGLGLEGGQQTAPQPAEQSKTVTTTNRGDVAATLVHIYRGGLTVELGQALDRYVDEAVKMLPHFDGSIALVLDASASTRGYGEREFACISQSQALRLVLERCCAKLRVITVGGAGDPPRPEGATDLAGAVLDSLATSPDLVVIVSDGYENDAAGDLARVVATLPAIGIRTSMVFCHSKFTAKDDLTLRRPAAALPELEFWHQDDFADLLWSLFGRAAGERGREFLRGALLRRLDLLEKEVRPWICSLS